MRCYSVRGLAAKPRAWIHKSSRAIQWAAWAAWHEPQQELCAFAPVGGALVYRLHELAQVSGNVHGHCLLLRTGRRFGFVVDGDALVLFAVVDLVIGVDNVQLGLLICAVEASAVGAGASEDVLDFIDHGAGGAAGDIAFESHLGHGVVDLAKLVGGRETLLAFDDSAGASCHLGQNLHHGRAVALREVR